MPHKSAILRHAELRAQFPVSLDATFEEEALVNGQMAGVGDQQEGWWQRHLIAAFARGNCRSARLRLTLTPAGGAPARHAPPSHGQIAACQNLLGPMRTYADLCGPMRTYA